MDPIPAATPAATGKENSVNGQEDKQHRRAPGLKF